MSIELLVKGIQEHNAADPDKEVVQIVVNPDYWQQLTDSGQLGDYVQIMATSPDAVRFVFQGIPIEPSEGVKRFSFKTGPRKLN
ncbi:hypothetical protein [Pseudomonas juntendi]|uniref:hypothetical protein n=1 Tax=Pseudomonas juntendi TaxID=2666183 RepID=UPI00244C82E2|nr:hypothetical protein [Pseudomonas juntendi]MDG9890580.1 hypothetical protein [Pseudomonas juntendi]